MTAADPARGAVGALALALTERDRATGEHCERVVALAGAVARRLSLDGEDIERIAAAALLHDIGKLAVPDGILRKPGPLDADEARRMREHPLVGERILRAVPGLGPVARIVRHAAEHVDGSATPTGCAATTSRSAAASCSSATPTRRWSPTALPRGPDPRRAVAELVAGAGTQFDERVIDALLGYLADRMPVDYAAQRSAA